MATPDDINPEIHTAAELDAQVAQQPATEFDNPDDRITDSPYTPDTDAIANGTEAEEEAVRNGDDPHQAVRDLAAENAAKDEQTRSIGQSDDDTTPPAAA